MVSAATVDSGRLGRHLGGGGTLFWLGGLAPLLFIVTIPSGSRACGASGGPGQRATSRTATRSSRLATDRRSSARASLKRATRSSMSAASRKARLKGSWFSRSLGSSLWLQIGRHHSDHSGSGSVQDTSARRHAGGMCVGGVLVWIWGPGAVAGKPRVGRLGDNHHAPDVNDNDRRPRGDCHRADDRCPPSFSASSDSAADFHTAHNGGAARDDDHGRSVGGRSELLRHDLRPSSSNRDERGRAGHL